MFQLELQLSSAEFIVERIHDNKFYITWLRDVTNYDVIFRGKSFVQCRSIFFIKSENYWSIIYALCISVIKRLTHLFLVILLFPIAITFTFTITIITDSFNMPGKRKVNYSARSAFWHCGDCRKSCTANSVQCDTCNSWYHYQCQQLDLVDIELR